MCKCVERNFSFLRTKPWETFRMFFCCLQEILIFSITFSSNHALFNFFFYFYRGNSPLFRPLAKLTKKNEKLLLIFLIKIPVSSENFESVETAASYLDKNWSCSLEFHTPLFFSLEGINDRHLFSLKVRAALLKLLNASRRPNEY